MNDPGIAAGFVRRLNQACDDVPNIIPPFGEGRQIELAKRMGMSQQGVRKWFTGETMPRRDAMKRLAKTLEVDESWLALGIRPELTLEEKRTNARNMDGAAMLVMGMMTIGGAACAIPGEDDPARGYVDFYAILRGTQMAIRVAFARTVSPGVYHMMLPREYHRVRIIGVIPGNGLKYDMIDLDAVNTATHVQRRSGAYMIQISKHDGRYVTGDTVWRPMKTFGELV